MNEDIWRSREADAVAKYAEKMRPADDAELDTDEQAQQNAAAQPQRATSTSSEEIDFSYMNGPPPKDLLNYKNMELEMSLWAKTGTGWMSVGVLLVLMVACFILISMLWILRGAIY
ncbi:MAG: hypothetical protein ABIQ44_08410 [Chloroflexia bacterium]